MSAIIGIDLGTTFSAISKLDETGRVVIVHNSEGGNITPSVVLFTGEDSVIVGEEARKSYQIDPESFGRFKRKMGTEQVYESRYGQHTPTSLSTLLLKHLKNEAEKAVGEIEEAVITVPANFANDAREATLEAARTAGLNVNHIINEPTAAALYFAQQSGKMLNGIYVIYDLGGGTFDVTVARIHGQDIEVLSSEGVSQLGGDDFDKKIQEVVAVKYKQATGGTLTNEDYSCNHAEEDKKTLSRREQTKIRISGQSGQTSITLTRAEFEEAIASLIAQTEMLCETAMSEARITPSEIQEVILVGGSTRTPAIQTSVQRLFGKEPVTFANPDEVVALGAALYAGYKTDKSNLNALQAASIGQIELDEITNHYFGFLALSGDETRNFVIIKKGAKIPCSVSEPFFTVSDGQTKVRCEVTQSGNPETDPKFVNIIWNGSLEVPPGRPAGQKIEVTFSYNSNQEMQCAFVDSASGGRIDINLAGDKFKVSEDLDIERFVIE